MSPGRLSPAAATRAVASCRCSSDRVTERTCAPRAAARRHSSPQPVPISSTLLPGPDAGRIEQPVDLAVLCHGRDPPRLPGVSGTARSSRSSSRRGTRRTGRWTGRSARRCCAGPGRCCYVAVRGWRTTASGRNRCSRGGMSSARRLRELSEQTGGVGGAPVAGHVGLAEADQAEAADAANQRIGTVHHHGRQRRIGGADDRSVGIDHPDRQPGRRAPEQPVGDGAGGGAHRSVGHPCHGGPAL